MTSSSARRSGDRTQGAAARRLTTEENARLPMKCQKCNKQATFHITEMIDAHPLELHFCQEHAYEYLHQSGAVESIEDAAATFGQLNPAASGAEKDKLGLREATDELVTDDFQMCPCCHSGFQDFRKSGLFGCPHDYVVFRDRLEPFLFGVHGATEHVGKRPLRAKGTSDAGTTLVHLRNLMQDAIEMEDYERASTLRDRIAEIEKSLDAPVGN